MKTHTSSPPHLDRSFGHRGDLDRHDADRHREETSWDRSRFPPLRLLGWLATAAMAMAVLVMLGSWLD
jgi:hypothetical protein